LRKLPVTSNASRNIVQAKIPFEWPKLPKSLRVTSLSKAGRASNGRIVCWTKKSRKLLQPLPRVNFSFRPTMISAVNTLFLLPQNSKLVGLVSTLDGGLTFLQLTESKGLFDYLYRKSNTNHIKRLFLNPTFAYVFQLYNTDKVSFLELQPGLGAQYARSAGVFATFIKLNLFDHTVTFRLPSGVEKIVSIYASVMVGPVAFKSKKLLRNTKSGFWRNLGLKSKVRGVARNPVDHPHGGRTKSIRYPRTPWGKTTKYK